MLSIVVFFGALTVFLRMLQGRVLRQSAPMLGDIALDVGPDGIKASDNHASSVSKERGRTARLLIVPKRTLAEPGAMDRLRRILDQALGSGT